MSSYAYVAVDPQGIEARGRLEVADQNEALRRLKEMGLFPTKVQPARAPEPRARAGRPGAACADRRWLRWPWRGRVSPARLVVFTRQLATLIEAGLPLLRSLRLLRQQEDNRTFKRVLEDMALVIESGGTLEEAVVAHPRAFSRLYVSMVRAGEVSGALELTLGRLAQLLEKAQRIKGKVKAAMVYPAAVLLVAGSILLVLMVWVVPRFQQVFQDLLPGGTLPVFTRFVFGLSTWLVQHLAGFGLVLGAVAGLVTFALRTSIGRSWLDHAKLVLPVLGPLFRKVAISRFARTLGTLVSNGVPILQALTIVKATAGNVAVGHVVSAVHENVKQGEPIAPTLRESRVFPAMVVGMIEVGEQTGALPEMLMKIADNYDEEVDRAAGALAALLEPLMIVLLAVVVGSIVIAMYLPLIYILNPPVDGAVNNRPGE